jgi:hypothetical protein
MKHLQWVVALAVSVLVAGPTAAQDKAIDAVRKHIDELKNGKGQGELKLKDEAAVRAALPGYQIVNARFRVFPVARIMPEGLRASNLFAVTSDGKVEHIKDVKAMEKFFSAHQNPAKSEKDAKEVLAAWLTLTQEFHQDGFYKFEILDKQFAIAQDVGLNARGRMVVMQGGNGDLIAELVYGKDGRLAKVTETAKIRPGPRPICQATKLLDTDPVVRRIAEQDLLIMGLAAREYLLEQRGLATPELRQAIDRLWEQIQKNGW